MQWRGLAWMTAALQDGTSKTPRRNWRSIDSWPCVGEATVCGSACDAEPRLSHELTMMGAPNSPHDLDTNHCPTPWPWTSSARLSLVSRISKRSCGQQRRSPSTQRARSGQSDTSNATFARFASWEILSALASIRSRIAVCSVLSWAVMAWTSQATPAAASSLPSQPQSPSARRRRSRHHNAPERSPPPTTIAPASLGVQASPVPTPTNESSSGTPQHRTTKAGPRKRRSRVGIFIPQSYKFKST